MHGKTDKNLETKEGRTMSHLVQKPSIPLSPQKTPCYADVFTDLPKTGNRPTNTGKLTKPATSASQEVGREIKVVRRLL